MNKSSFTLFLIAGFGVGAVSFLEPPETKITNGIIHARLYLPDPQTGYYRGSRFDWSGVIADLDYRGHHYFGRWFPKYSPTLHDAIQGPVEAFDPIGFDEAKPGGHFLKIGIGILSRTSDSAYYFATTYPIVNSGKWKVTS